MAPKKPEAKSRGSIYMESWEPAEIIYDDGNQKGVVSRSWGRFTSNGDEESPWGDENVLRAVLMKIIKLDSKYMELLNLISTSCILITLQEK